MFIWTKLSLSTGKLLAKESWSNTLIWMIKYIKVMTWARFEICATLLDGRGWFGGLNSKRRRPLSCGGWQQWWNRSAVPWVAFLVDSGSALVPDANIPLLRLDNSSMRWWRATNALQHWRWQIGMCYDKSHANSDLDLILTSSVSY